MCFVLMHCKEEMLDSWFLPIYVNSYFSVLEILLIILMHLLF